MPFLSMVKVTLQVRLPTLHTYICCKHDYEPIKAAEAAAAEGKAAASTDAKPAGQQPKDPPSSSVQGTEPTGEPAGASSDAHTAQTPIQAAGTSTDPAAKKDQASQAAALRIGPEAEHQPSKR